MTGWINYIKSRYPILLRVDLPIFLGMEQQLSQHVVYLITLYHGIVRLSSMDGATSGYLQDFPVNLNSEFLENATRILSNRFKAMCS